MPHISTKTTPHRSRLPVVRKHGLSVYVVAACVLATAVSAQVSQTSEPVSVVSAELRPGVVFEAETSLVVVMQPEGGVEAVELSQGETLWTSQDVDKPLLIVRDRMLAQTESEDGALILSVVEVKSGEPVNRLSAELPDGVLAIIDDHLDRSFSLSAQQFKDTVLVRWTEVFQPVAAVQRLQQDPVVTEGVFRVDLDDEQVEPLDYEEYARFFAQPAPDLLDGERMINVPGVQFRSASGNAVLTSEKIADNRTWEKYQWTIWGLITGERIGRFNDFQRFSNFAVLGSTLLQDVQPHMRVVDQKPVSSPLAVRAVDLKDGREIWQRPVRDTTYRGPVPH